MMARPAPAQFLVLVHDVAPCHQPEVEAILRMLQEAQVERAAIALALVPRWHGEPLGPRDASLRALAGECGEVLLHGWEHRRERGGGAASLLTGRADEFGGLREEEAAWRLRRGRAELEGFLEGFVERGVRGWVPPAWQPGPVTGALLEKCGLAYGVGLASLWGSATVPLATWSWDVGPAGLWRAGEWAGRLLQWRRHAIPAIVFHPRDLRRGLAGRGVRLVQALARAGARPILPRDLAGP